MCSSIHRYFQQSPSDLLSSDLRNSSETIPKAFTLLKATDVEIGSRLHIQRGGSYVTLLEVKDSSVPEMLRSTWRGSNQVTTFSTRSCILNYTKMLKRRFDDGNDRSYVAGDDDDDYYDDDEEYFT